MDGGGGAIPTNLRLLAAVEALAALGRPATPTEVNAALGLPKPTIHRLFATLEIEGFVQRAPSGPGFEPGPRMRRLSRAVQAGEGPRTARRAILRDLSRAIGETCNVAVPGEGGMLYAERVETEWPLRIQLPVGSRVPFHATTSGKMHLASLSPRQLSATLSALPLEACTARTLTDPAALAEEIGRIRTDGHATDREEFMDGMIALAVPLRDAEGRMSGTLSFHAPVQRMTPERCPRPRAPTFAPGWRGRGEGRAFPSDPASARSSHACPPRPRGPPRPARGRAPSRPRARCAMRGAGRARARAAPGRCRGGCARSNDRSAPASRAVLPPPAGAVRRGRARPRADRRRRGHPPAISAIAPSIRAISASLL